MLAIFLYWRRLHLKVEIVGKSIGCYELKTFSVPSEAAAVGVVDAAVAGGVAGGGAAAGVAGSEWR